MEFPPAQASAVTNLPLRTVHKLIERRLIRPRLRRKGRFLQRMLTREQLLYLRLESKGLRLLPMATRRSLASNGDTESDAPFASAYVQLWPTENNWGLGRLLREACAIAVLWALTQPDRLRIYPPSRDGKLDSEIRTGTTSRSLSSAENIAAGANPSALAKRLQGKLVRVMLYFITSSL